MSQESSYRHILRSSSIIGGASVVNILIGLARMKVVAIVLGPAGVGLVGLLQQLMNTVSTIAGMGISTAGTRQIAEAVGHGDQTAISATRRALFWATLVFALSGAGSLWLFSAPLATLILGDAGKVDLVRWLAVGVALSIAAGSQAALLNGLRRIGDLARISVLSSTFSTLLVVSALFIWGKQALITLLLAAPMTSFLFGYIFVVRLTRERLQHSSITELKKQWTTLLKLGFSLMLSALITIGGGLVVRALVQKELNSSDLGFFTASWTLSVTYIGFVLGAMGTDYYPRLTTVIADQIAATRMVNEQTEVALLLAGPIFIAMMGLAPWVFELLYSHAFAQATGILRWQIVADILKIMSWPLGFTLVASGAGKTFILTESIGICVFVLGVALGLSQVGVIATGMAYLMMYMLYLPLVRWFGGKLIGFHWSRAVRLQSMQIMATVLLVAFIAFRSEIAGAVVGIILSMVQVTWALIRLATISHATGRLAKLARMGEKIRTWFKQVMP